MASNHLSIFGTGLNGITNGIYVVHDDLGRNILRNFGKNYTLGMHIDSENGIWMMHSPTTFIVSPLTAIGSSVNNGIVFVENENAQALAKNMQGVDLPIGMTVLGYALAVSAPTNFMGNKISMVGTPTEETDAANKAYVDSAIQTAIGNAIGGSY